MQQGVDDRTACWVHPPEEHKLVRTERGMRRRGGKREQLRTMYILAIIGAEDIVTRKLFKPWQHLSASSLRSFICQGSATV